MASLNIPNFGWLNNTVNYSIVGKMDLQQSSSSYTTMENMVEECLHDPPTGFHYYTDEGNENAVHSGQRGSRSFNTVSSIVEQEVDGRVNVGDLSWTFDQHPKHTTEAELVQPKIDGDLLKTAIQNSEISMLLEGNNISSNDNIDYKNYLSPDIISEVDNEISFESFNLDIMLDKNQTEKYDQRCFGGKQKKKHDKSKRKAQRAFGEPGTQKEKLYKQGPMEDKAKDKKRRDAIRAKKNRDRNKQEKNELEVELKTERQLRRSYEKENEEIKSKLKALEAVLKREVTVKTSTTFSEGRETQVIYVPYQSQNTEIVML